MKQLKPKPIISITVASQHYKLDCERNLLQAHNKHS